MKLRPFIESELAANYRVLEGLLDLLSDEDLDWKPSTGRNWLTVGQLLDHLCTCGGFSFQAVASGEHETMPPEVAENPQSGLPPAEAFASVTSVAEARRRIVEDRKLAIDVVAAASDDDLERKPAPVWWDPRDASLGQQFVYMIQHLNQHKGQLYYYLKLMGRNVDTSHLWGM